jgi:hypothetical protein
MVNVQELQDLVRGLSILGRRLGILDRQVCGFPYHDAVGNFTDLIKSDELIEADAPKPRGGSTTAAVPVTLSPIK